MRYIYIYICFSSSFPSSGRNQESEYICFSSFSSSGRNQEFERKPLLNSVRWEPSCSSSSSSSSSSRNQEPERKPLLNSVRWEPLVVSSHKEQNNKSNSYSDFTSLHEPIFGFILAPSLILSKLTPYTVLGLASGTRSPNRH